MSGGLHWDQPAPRQWNAPMAGNPRNPAMSPHTKPKGPRGWWKKSPETEGLVAGGARAPKEELPDPEAL